MKSKPCSYCLNSYIDSDLSADNDLSYLSVGETDKAYSMFLRSGDKKPTALIVSHWDENVKHNVDIAIYKMKYCPECGRRLIENEI